MKQLILTIGFILIGFPIFAQDVILKKNAEEVQAKILKVSESEIEFKHWERPDGPTYIVPTREVFMITYQNGTKEVVSLFQDQSGKTFRQSDRFPHYQGEISAAYGLYIDKGEGTIGLETVHGARINPNLFIGTGVGVNYFYQYDEIILPVFVDAKGYLPVGMKNALYLAVDIGVVALSDYASTSLYFTLGPGITFGRQDGRTRGDLSIRFQYLGENRTALLLRIGIGF